MKRLGVMVAGGLLGVGLMVVLAQFAFPPRVSDGAVGAVLGSAGAVVGMLAAIWFGPSEGHDDDAF